jgi:hypothetical protein
MEKTPITFTAGCAISNNNYYLSASIDELDSWDTFSRVFIYRHQSDTNWSSHDLDGWKVISVAYTNLLNNRSLISLDKEGNVEIFQQAGEEYQQICPVTNEQFIYGQFNRLRVIQDRIYACGDGAKIYIYEDENWKSIANNLEEKPLEIPKNDDFFLNNDQDLTFKKNLYDINGFDNNNVYVCGTQNDEGFIAFFNGLKWLEVNRITPSALYAIVPCPDGKNILVLGQYGTLLRGNIDNGFKNLKDISINSTFYNAAFYNNKIYIASEQGLYLYEEGKYSIVSELEAVQGVISVEVKENILWVLTYKKLIRYDGNVWEIISHPDNDELDRQLLKCEAGDVCPYSGDWYSPANNMQKRYFIKGEIMPEIKDNSWGETIWYLDMENQ